jgi:hypothetical protein
MATAQRRAREHVPMIPYSSEDVEFGWCQRTAADLRASGKYRRVTVRRSAPAEQRWNAKTESHETISFGRIYVGREQPV